jgi:hypothetical protein
MGHMEERGDGNGQLFLYRGVGERMGWRGCPISTTTRWKGGGSVRWPWSECGGHGRHGDDLEMAGAAAHVWVGEPKGRWDWQVGHNICAEQQLIQIWNISNGSRYDSNSLKLDSLQNWTSWTWKFWNKIWLERSWAREQLSLFKVPRFRKDFEWKFKKDLGLNLKRIWWNFFLVLQIWMKLGKLLLFAPSDQLNSWWRVWNSN